ncbi:MAG: hypothetical protein JKX97_05485, partial [Candidatus Lindowbacteria bacterium]|nr:hypothetical protein [Candidatus Lindowbacteria bacterium]
VTSNQQIVRKAVELGGKIRAEDGIANAIAVIERVARRSLGSQNQ